MTQGNVWQHSTGMWSDSPFCVVLSRAFSSGLFVVLSRGLFCGSFASDVQCDYMLIDGWDTLG